MTYKTAYLWGPVSSFSGQLAAHLVQKGWHVHIATKGAFHVALSPLDLRSHAQEAMEKALGGHDKFKIFEERVRFLDVNETPRGTKYDAFVFCGLPPNFDEPRVSRAPWAAENFQQIIKRFKDVPMFVVSSLWGAVQADGVVPEEIECERRKPLTQFEAVAQQYEKNLLRNLHNDESRWYLVRLPMISAGSHDGRMLNFSGPTAMIEKLCCAAEHNKDRSLILSYNPDATMWFLPVDIAVQLFTRIIEDDQRPRICNLVSTQATLNQEWLQHLAKALGYKKATSADSDTFNLPGFLRKALNDNILVKSRGLFEVTGRYQQLPVALDDGYFQRAADYCKHENWGRIQHLQQPHHTNGNGKKPPVPDFDPHFAREYFTKFLPSHVTTDSVKEVTMDDTAGIGIKVDDANELRWVLKSDNGTPVVVPMHAEPQEPKVCIGFTGKGVTNLVQRKVSLERALVMREAWVTGNPIQVLRACNFLKKFLKEHPYTHEETELQAASKK